MVESLPANAGDMGLSPGPGRSHMLWSGWAREPQLLSTFYVMEINHFSVKCVVNVFPCILTLFMLCSFISNLFYKVTSLLEKKNKLYVWSQCSATREAAIVRGPHTAMKSGPRSPQLEKALAQKRRSNTAKNN